MFRPGINKEEIIKKLSDEDWKFINEKKEYETKREVPKTSMIAKVLLQADFLRMQRDKCIMQVNQILSQIEDLKASILKHKVELESGIIKTEFKYGIPMIKDELVVLIKKEVNMAYALSRDIINPLKELCSLGGHKDVSGNVVITDEEVNSYLISVESELSQLGYKLFDDKVNQK
jgi:hypothetical protein